MLRGVLIGVTAGIAVATQTLLGAVAWADPTPDPEPGPPPPPNVNALTPVSPVDFAVGPGVWAFAGNRIAVRFAYECHDDSGNWMRAYGNENWEFNEQGFMMRRFASINDLPIKESERKFHWPLGRRPDDHPGLSELGL